MKIEKNKLVKVFWKSKEFNYALRLDNIEDLILDSIKVFGKAFGGDYQKVPFLIEYIDEKPIIYPKVCAAKYYIGAERVVNVNAVKFDANDCIQESFTRDNSYEFLVKGNIEID